MDDTNNTKPKIGDRRKEDCPRCGGAVTWRLVTSNAAMIGEGGAFPEPIKPNEVWVCVDECGYRSEDIGGE